MALVADITARKRADDALREAENRLRTIVEGTKALLVGVDANGHFTFVNEATAAAVGYPASSSELIGKPYLHFIHPEDRQRVLDTFIDQANNRRPSCIQEFRLVDTAGNVKWFSFLSSLEIKDGQVVGQSGVAQDVTEHRRAEEAAKESEDRFRRIVDNIHDAIYVDDTDARVTFANDQFLTLFGFERDQLSHVKLEDYVAPEWRTALRDRHERRLRGEAVPSSFLYEGLGPNGRRLWLESTVVLLFDDQGRAIGTQSADRDITQRKLAEDAILTEKAFSEALLDSLPGIFFLFDQTGRFLRWNRALEAVSGYSSPEIAAMHPLAFITAMDRGSVAETIQRVFEHGFADVEAALAVKDGEQIPYYFTGARFIVDGAPCCIGTGIDVTARKVLEAELRQSQKIEAIGRLAGGVAHDFNNIVGVILGYGELAESELAPGSPAREYVAEMVQAAQRAATLTRQLQAFSRKQVLQPRRLDLNELIANAHKMLDRLIGEDLSLVVRPAPELGTVLADPGQIDQILLNLAINARDAMPKGGTLTLETADVDLREVDATADRPAIKPGRYVMVAVSDTGAGMDAETQRRLFEPFFTTKPTGQGHRSGSGDGLRHRQTEWRLHLGLQRAGPRHDVQDLPAAGRRAARRQPSERRFGDHRRRQRENPAGGRQPGVAGDDPAAARGERLHRVTGGRRRSGADARRGAPGADRSAPDRRRDAETWRR